jgi:hypothetical protein
MGQPVGNNRKDEKKRKPSEVEQNRAKWWGDMYQMRFVATAGIACFVWLMWNFPDNLQYLPICIGIMLLAWWVSGKA